jgi:hypothetical protein
MWILRRLWDALAVIFHRPVLPTLTSYLPSVPLGMYLVQPDNSNDPHHYIERYESMLLDIMRAPPEYADAAILIGKAAQALRARGDDVFAEGLVVFALSRMVPDPGGTIAFQRLRMRLGDLPTRKSLIATLLRLEEQGVVEFDGDKRDELPNASRFMRLDDVRIRLRVVP